MGPPLRCSLSMERDATLLYVKSKNRKQHELKFRVQKRRSAVRVESEDMQVLSSGKISL